MDSSHYNNVVNVTDDKEHNGVNFLESLRYRSNLFNLYKLIESKNFQFIPSFKSKRLVDENLISVGEEKESLMEVFLIKTQDKDLVDNLSEFYRIESKGNDIYKISINK